MLSLLILKKKKNQNKDIKTNMFIYWSLIFANFNKFYNNITYLKVNTKAIDSSYHILIFMGKQEHKYSMLKL